MSAIRTVEDYQNELSAKENDLKAANELLASAQKEITAFTEDNSKLKAECETHLKSLNDIKADNSVLVEKLSAATTEIEALKKSEADANQKAISLLNQVGQPVPVEQKPEQKTDSQISQLKGLAKVQAYLAAKKQTK